MVTIDSGNVTIIKRSTIYYFWILALFFMDGQ